MEFPSEPPFRPELTNKWQRWEWTVKRNYHTRMEAHATAKTGFDHEAARRLNSRHIKCMIETDREALRIAWGYVIQFDHKEEETGIVERIERLQEFSEKRVADILNGIPEGLRYDAADDMASKGIRSFYYRKLRMEDGGGIVVDERGKEWQRHIDETIEAIDALFPGQLETLHRKIQTGTLGK